MSSSSVVPGADLTCSHSVDFGPNARVEWRFIDMRGSQTYVVYDGKLTGRLFLKCTHVSRMSNGLPSQK